MKVKHNHVVRSLVFKVGPQITISIESSRGALFIDTVIDIGRPIWKTRE